MQGMADIIFLAGQMKEKFREQLQDRYIVIIVFHLMLSVDLDFGNYDVSWVIQKNSTFGGYFMLDCSDESE